MTTLVDQIKQSTQLRWNRVNRFRPKINMKMDVGPYTIKTVDCLEELIECFQLRHEVFHREFRGIEKTGLDVDRFDVHFDHLVIIHRETQKIIGTYRLSCSTFSPHSYTALEFKLNLLWMHRGPFLELGRACIRKDHRKGSVISLLWRGIAEYMKLSKAEILFGCSSLKINHPRDAALVYRYLVENRLVTQEFMCRPTRRFLMKDFDAWYSYFKVGLREEQIQEAESLLPSLIKSYLKLGAKIACEPAFDEEFDCIDFLTVLRKEDLGKSLAQRFNIEK